MYHYAGNNPIRYSDPDGEFALNAAAAVIGALSGAAIGAVTTAIAGGSGRDIAAAALGGAASGALAGVTLGGSLVTQAIGATAMGAVSAVVGDVVTNAVSGNEITLEGVGKAALGGAVGGLVGFGAGKALSAVGNKIQSATSPKPTAASANTTNFKGVDVIQDNSIINPKQVDARGRTNVQRMQKGLAPLGPDGKSVNLHHVDQTMTGPVKEITATEHTTNYSILHHNTGQSPSQIDRKAFNNWRVEYWVNRANDF